MTTNGTWLAGAALATAVAMPVAADDWSAWVQVDRMTGEEEVFGVYTATRLDKPRPSVYADIEGDMIISCDDRTAWFRLSDSEGYLVEFMPHGTEDWLEIPARFDSEKVQELTAYNFGERSLLVFDMDPDMLSLAEGRRRVMMEVPSVKGPKPTR